MNEKSFCYWCGKQKTSDDHLPPKSFYPKGDRGDNFITIPSCNEHNQEMHKLDDRFRFYLQAGSVDASEKAKEMFSQKTMRIFERNESKGFANNLLENMKLAVIDGKQYPVFEFPSDFQIDFFEKIIRGLYYHHINAVVPENFIVTHLSFQLKTQGVNYAEQRQSIQELITQFGPEDLKYGTVANPRIFEYVYYTSGKVFFTLMSFYENIEFFGFVTPYHTES